MTPGLGTRVWVPGLRRGTSSDGLRTRRSRRRRRPKGSGTSPRMENTSRTRRVRMYRAEVGSSALGGLRLRRPQRRLSLRRSLCRRRKRTRPSPLRLRLRPARRRRWGARRRRRRPRAPGRALPRPLRRLRSSATSVTGPGTGTRPGGLFAAAAVAAARRSTLRLPDAVAAAVEGPRTALTGTSPRRRRLKPDRRNKAREPRRPAAEETATVGAATNRTAKEPTPPEEEGRALLPLRPPRVSAARERVRAAARRRSEVGRGQGALAPMEGICLLGGESGRGSVA